MTTQASIFIIDDKDTPLASPLNDPEGPQSMVSNGTWTLHVTRYRLVPSGAKVSPDTHHCHPHPTPRATLLPHNRGIGITVTPRVRRWSGIEIEIDVEIHKRMSCILSMDARVDELTLELIYKPFDYYLEWSLRVL